MVCRDIHERHPIIPFEELQDLYVIPLTMNNPFAYASKEDRQVQAERRAQWKRKRAIAGFDVDDYHHDDKENIPPSKKVVTPEMNASSNKSLWEQLCTNIKKS